MEATTIGQSDGWSAAAQAGAQMLDGRADSTLVMVIGLLCMTYLGRHLLAELLDPEVLKAFAHLLTAWGDRVRGANGSSDSAAGAVSPAIAETEGSNDASPVE